MSYELDEAVAAIEGKMDNYFRKLKTEVKSDAASLDDLRARFREVEQKVAGGYVGSSRSFSGGSRDLGRAIVDSEQFKQLAKGQARRVKLTLPEYEFKNTIIGDAGSPLQPSDVLNPAQRLPGIVMPAERSLRLRDVLPRMPAASNVCEITRELAYSNGAAPQAGQGTLKAESDVTFELVETPIRDIAHFLKVSKQALSDQAALASYLDRRLRYGVLLAEETQLLTGDGTGSNMDGIIQNATAYTGADSSDNRFDTISRAIEQVEVAAYEPSVIVLNPADWREMTREKDGEEVYRLGLTPGANVWGLPIVVSHSMPVGQFVVMDAGRAAVLWDRQGVEVEMFEQDDDNVQRNLVTVRAEMRSAITVVLPAAVVHGSF